MARNAAIPQVGFRTGNVHESKAPSQDFDSAYCRFLLSHLSEPVAAMRARPQSPKPGGFSECEEPGLLTIFTEPRSKH